MSSYWYWKDVLDAWSQMLGHHDQGRRFPKWRFAGSWCVLRCSLQGSYLSLFNAKSHCFSRTGLPGMLIVSSPSFLHWQWRADSWLECVHCPISSMQALCLGVGAATGIHFFTPGFHLSMNSFLPLKLLKDDLEEYFKMLRKCVASEVQVWWRR